MALNERLCKYYRKKYIKYLKKVNKDMTDYYAERCADFTKFKINNKHKRFICGIDGSSTCLEEYCTEGFSKVGCMYLKGYGNGYKKNKDKN